MQQLTFDEFQPQIKTILLQVINDHEPVEVVLDDEHGVVVVDEDDFRSIMETVYLLRNPANAERLREGMRQHQSGQRRVIDVTAYLDGNRS